MRQRRFFTGVWLGLLLVQPLLAPAGRAAGQTVAQTTATPETARIDLLLKESRALMAKGSFDEVTPKAEEALTLSEKIGDRARQARALMQVATAAFHQGQAVQARETFKQAALLAAHTGDASLQSLALNSAAFLLIASGLYDDALYFLSQSLALRRQQKDRRGEALVLSSISPLYMDTGEFTKADALLEEALRLTRELKAEGKDVSELEEHVLMRISGGQFMRGNLDAALQAVQRALAGETERTSNASRIEVRERLGDLYAAAGNHEKASEVYRETIELARRLKIPISEGHSLGYLAWSQFQLGRAKEALPLILQALELVRQDGSRLIERIFVYYLAEIQKALQQHEAALANYRQAMSAVERARAQALPTEVSRGGMVSSYQRVFAGAIDLLVDMRRQEEALKIAETYHARAFLDVLAESRIDLRADLDKEQRRREDRIFERISGIQKELWRPKVAPERQSQLNKELQEAEAELESFQREMRRANPRYASVKYPQLLQTSRISEELLDADSALIEYVVSEPGSFAWVVRRGKIACVRLPGKKAIDGLIADYRNSLSEKVTSLTLNTALARLNAGGQRLYRQLFQPLEALIGTASRLIIVPDGGLAYLPFETLVGERPSGAGRGATGEYLIERFAISYAPSASALAAIQTAARELPKGGKGMIAFGDPLYAPVTQSNPLTEALQSTTLRLTEPADHHKQLPYTRKEIQEIGSLFPSSEQKTYLGAEAREQNVKAEDLSRYRYVHFAAHGIIDEEYPARSGIVLSAEPNSREDGVLQMSEVMRLKVNADLVTLSACRTGLGKLLNGEGMIGLTRAFLYAGASSVVVSLWNVNDTATADLMRGFYRNLQRGLAKDQALRQAKRELINGQKRAWRHPYFWAPFVLIGEHQ
jgi:CHAT domain-containing protein